MSRRSWRSTPRRRPTSSSCSRSAGVNCWGVADRTDYDLTQHQNHSGKSLEYLDPVTNERYIPYCIEPSLGVDRMVLAFLCNAYEEQELEGGDVRTVLHLHPALAPYKAAVLPLQKNKLGALASEIHADLAKYFPVDYDETGFHWQALSPSGRNRHAVHASAWTLTPKRRSRSRFATATPCCRSAWR